MAKKSLKAVKWRVAGLSVVLFPCGNRQNIDRKMLRSIDGISELEIKESDNAKVVRGRAGNSLFQLTIEERHPIPTESIRWTFTMLPFPSRGQQPPLFHSPDHKETVYQFLTHLEACWNDWGIQVNRVGASGMLVQLHESEKEANKSISQCLPNLKLPSLFSDLIFKINRPQKSRKSSLSGFDTINRLTTWSTLVQQTFELLDPTRSHLSFLSCFEFDVNTPLAKSNIDILGQVPLITRQLYETAMEIAEQGFESP